MQMSNDSEKVYRRKLDKWKARSNRILTKAYNLNRTYDNNLETVLKDLERSRDISIREAQEKIWNVSNTQCPRPRLPRQTDMPSYLAHPKVVTLPTPAELGSLLPKKIVKAKPEARKQYTRMSTRKLSTMKCDQIKVVHYRQLLNDIDESVKVTTQREGLDGDDEINPTAGATHDNETAISGGLEDMPMGLKRRNRNVTTDDSPEPRRGSTSQLVPRPTSCPTKQEKTVTPKKRPKTGRQRDSEPVPSGKVWKTNYLQMYHIQAEKHKRRMSRGNQVPFQLSRNQVDKNDTGDDSKPTDDANTRTRQSISDESFSKRGLHNRFQEQIAKPSPISTLMSPTAASDQRRKSTHSLFRRVNSVSTMDALHKEVKSIEQARNFRKNSLTPTEEGNQEEYLEDGELFDSMRKCRYIRWGEDEARIEELNEDVPLENQLKVLTLSVPNTY